MHSKTLFVIWQSDPFLVWFQRHDLSISSLCSIPFLLQLGQSYGFDLIVDLFFLLLFVVLLHISQQSIDLLSNEVIQFSFRQFRCVELVLDHLPCYFIMSLHVSSLFHLLLLLHLPHDPLPVLLVEVFEPPCVLKVLDRGIDLLLIFRIKGMLQKNLLLSWNCVFHNLILTVQNLIGKHVR